MPLVALTGEMGWLPTHYKQMNIFLKLFIQLESNTCNPLLQDWQSQLNKPLDPSSESGGKLVIYRQLQKGSLPPSYVLANMTVKRRRTIAAIHEGCLPLAVGVVFMYLSYL